MNNKRRTQDSKRNSINRKFFRYVSFVLLLLTAAAGLLFLTQRTEAADKFWIASGPGNFNDNANWSLTSGGPANTTAPGPTDTATFDGNGLGNCTFAADITIGSISIAATYTGTITVASGVNLTLGPFTNFVMNGGTFNTSNGTFFMNSGSPNGTFDQNGGVFNGNGTLNFNAGAVRFDGGTFNATSGTTTFHRTVFRTSGTFNHNNGTVILTGSAGAGVVGSFTFNNLTLNASDVLSFDPITVLNTLNLNSGGISGSPINAQGPVNVGPSFSGGTGFLSITGSAARTITFASGSTLPNLTVNAPNATITSSGSGTVNFQSLTFQSGIINQGPANFLFTSYSQTGGTFNASTASLTVNAGSGACTFSGVFNGSGPLDLNCGTVTVGGGSFTASLSNTTFHRALFHTAGTFNHNNGTAIFVSSSGGGINVTAPTQFNNLTLNNTGDNFSVTGTIDVAGTLKLQSGLVQSGTIQAQGNVVVENTFGFGAPPSGGSVSLTFNGNGNQTFTNNGGPNPTGSWTVNKSNGTLTAASSIVLGNNQALTITAGTLYLNNNSNLTCGALTIGAAGKLINDTATTITLGGNGSNTGTLDLEGGGITCPQSDTILLRSSVNGVRRNWSGNGIYRLVDLNVQDMGGGSATLPAIKVFSGTNSGNNNSNWTFDSNCPPNPTISPAAPFVNSGATVQFTPSGGTAPYVFSLPVNNSGGNITPGGLYTAGATKAVIDTVRVTDTFNNIGEVQVHINGPLHHFLVVGPGMLVAGVQASNLGVFLRDVFDTPVADPAGPVTVSIENNPGGATLSGTLTKTPFGGVVVFDDLGINKTGNGYTLRVQSGSVIAVSRAFNIVSNTPAQLEFVTQPSNSFATQTIVPSIQVRVRDAFGNQVQFPTTVTLALSGTTPGILTGINSAETLNGVATFEVAESLVGNGFTLQAIQQNCPTIISAPFNVFGQFEVNNTNEFGPGSLRAAIQNSNIAGGPTPNLINFNIPGTGPFTLIQTNQLPPITHPIVIDGTTQPGYAGSPLIELRGGCTTIDSCSGGLVGLQINAGNSTIKGLAITQWPLGLDLNGGGNTVQGNYIGTNITGTAAMGNQVGIHFAGATNTSLVGGSTTQQRNLISGNGIGIRTQVCALGDSILGNFIGSDISGTNPIPNNIGLDILCPLARVGGPAAGEANLIAFNTAQGIKGISPLIRGNSIHSNGQLGIDVFPDGINPLTNVGTPAIDYPILNSAVTSGNSITITGTVKTPTQPNSSRVLDFYSSPTCDASGFGEGRSYLGSLNLSSNVAGLASFTATLSAQVQAGHAVTATTSVPNVGPTSEFSQCRFVSTGVFTISGKVVSTQGSSLSAVSVQLSGGDNRTTSTDSQGNYVFTNVGGGPNYTVTAISLDFQFAPATRTINNLSSNQTSQDFSGTRTRFFLSGPLTGIINGNAFPLSGVKMTLSGVTAQTVFANGVYVFQSLPLGSYTITPSLAGYVFSPASFDVTITNSDLVRPFTATTATPPLEGRLVFQSVWGAVGTINADGTALTPQLFSGTKPLFTRGGRRIHYLDSNNFLRLRNADGTESSITGPTQTPVVTLEEPGWSPDDNKAALTTGQQKIRIVDFTGQLLFEIPVNTPGWPRIPTWLTDTRLVFAASDGNDLELYRIDTNGSNLFQLTNNSVTDFYPTASPDGSKIAFLRGNATQMNLLVMNADGSNAALVATAVTTRPTWSPDGTRLAFTQTNGNGLRVVSTTINGSGLRVIANQSLGSILSWGLDFDTITPGGSNVTVNSGGTTVTFGGVSSSGTTTVTPIPAASAGTAPNGFLVGGMAYEITTTAAVSAPITVCFTVPSSTSQNAFNAMALLHYEGGVLVDRTTTRTFATKQICGSVTTLSPFAIGEHIENLPSIHGVARDDHGAVLSGVVVQLEGSESRTTVTDLFGQFHFVNLASGNYTIQPSLEGYLFNQPTITLIGVTGENAIAFTGIPASFAIGGKSVDGSGVAIPNVEITLAGDAASQTITSNDGSYNFAGLTAGGSYTVAPIKSGFTFSQPVITIPILTANQTNVNFVGNIASPGPTPTPTPTPNALKYTALGDSITFGLSDTQGGFTTRYQQTMQTDLSLAVNQVNLGVPGETSTQLLDSLRNEQSVRSAVSNSQVVTFNIGGNDLLPVIFQYRNAQCGGADNLDCMRTAMTLLKSNFSAIVAELLLLRGTNNTVIRTMDFYNPFVGVLKSGDSWAGDGLNDFQAIKPFADDINNFIATQAAANKIPCARVSIAFNGTHADEDAATKGLIAADGIHPSTTGHALIADLLRVAAYAPLIPNNAQPKVQIAVGDYAVKENAGFATISVVRSGNAGVPLSVDFSTADGTASQHDDYIATIGRLNFAAGEQLKTIPLLIVNDVNNEANETLTFTLTNPTGGALIAPTSANLVITNDDSGVQQPNPVDEARFFAQEHYFDFLNRFPDQSGWDFWTNEIVSCGTDQSCIEVKRINVSAAFFLSIEFQETGYLIERTYKTAFGDGVGQSTLGGAHSMAVPIVRLNEFLADTREIGAGLVVGQAGWEQVLENNKVRFMNDFVQRPRFTQASPLSLTESQFVDQLNSNAGNHLSAQQRDRLITDLMFGLKTRGEVVRAIAEHPSLSSAEFNRAFVLMQYYGYLRRNPNDQPDSDYTGYDFWLTKLNQFGGNFVNAEMVKAFILSGEYRHRFGP